MNWRKLTIGITTINILAWALLEIWSRRYADSNISDGAAVLIAFHLVGYYIIAIASRVPAPPPNKVTPVNCPGHDWQKDKYGGHQKCTKCGAERGFPNS